MQTRPNRFNNWRIETIEKILPEEFFELISKNKMHIEKTFPVTVSSCLDLEKATNRNKKIKRTIFSILEIMKQII